MAVKFTAKQWEAMSKKLATQFPDDRVAEIIAVIQENANAKTSKASGSRGGGRNPYILWMKDNRQAIKEELGPDAKTGQIAKRGGELWKLLSDEDKKPYLEQAAAAKTAAGSEPSAKRSSSPKSPFERSDESATIEGYEGPVIGKFLMKRVAPGWGVGRFGTLADAVAAANKLGGQCGGITMEKNAYILTVGNDFITPPPGHRATAENDCWMAWRKIDHVAEVVERPKRVKKAEEPKTEENKVEENKVEENKVEENKVEDKKVDPVVETDAGETDDEDDDDDDEISVETWEYEGVTYLVDPDTNQVYDAESQDVIGQRVGNKLAKF